MNIQKTVCYWLMVIVGVSLLESCSTESMEMKMEAGEPALSFDISRTGTNEDQLIRVLVAERSVDHTTATDGGLYCGLDKRFFLDKGATTYLAQDLKLQWYKFVFLGVPDIKDEGYAIDGQQLFSDVKAEPETLEATTNDFSKLLIDYGPILELQAKQPDASEKYDLNLYRGVANRWMTRPDETEGSVVPSEQMAISPITGEFLLDLGLLPDQFEHPVSTVTLTLKVPGRVYIYDNYRENGYPLGDDVIQVNESSVYVENNTVTFTYVYTPGSEELAGKKHCKLNLNLLPCSLDGTLTVAFKTVDGVAPEEQGYAIHSDATSSPLVEIKPETRTTLLFNGMHAGYFEVRYAGFDGSGIGVADDDWNGWPTDGDNGQGSSPGDGQDNGQGNGQDSSPDDGQDNGQEGGA